MTALAFCSASRWGGDVLFSRAGHLDVAWSANESITASCLVAGQSSTFLSSLALSRANAQILHGDIFILCACYFHVTRLTNVALTTFLGPTDLDRSATLNGTVPFSSAIVELFGSEIDRVDTCDLGISWTTNETVAAILRSIRCPECTTVDGPFILRCAHGRRRKIGWFDAVLLDVALRANESATTLLRAEGVGGTACDGLLADAGTVLVLSPNLGGRGVGKDEEDGDRRPGEDDGGEDLHLAGLMGDRLLMQVV